jgi:hypothetical protein
VYEEKPELRRLEAGAHVIGNGDPDSRRLPKIARRLDEAEAIASRRSEAPARARACAPRTQATRIPSRATCIHAGGYGTRSSTLLRRGRRPDQDVFRFSDGPPCSHPYRDFTPLLTQLDQTGMRAGAAERTHA